MFLNVRIYNNDRKNQIMMEKIIFLNVRIYFENFEIRNIHISKQIREKYT